MKTDSMRLYMRHIGNYPLITTEQEKILASRIQQGDAEARHQLIRANLRLVVKIAHDFKGLGLPLQDLISEGNIGLMRAAEKFDPNKGAKFSSYGAWWIKQAMRRALFEKSKMIRVPVASAGKIRKIRAIYNQLKMELQREPSNTEIALQSGFSERVVRRLRRLDLRTISLEDPIQDGETGQIKNLIQDDRLKSPAIILDVQESIEQIRHFMQKLTPREQNILFMRFGLNGHPPKTLEEVSRQVGRTRERIRQIQKKALKKLRDTIAQEHKKERSQQKKCPTNYSVT